MTHPGHAFDAKPATQVRYSNHSDQWWTPPEWFSWVYRTLADDELVYDPCPRSWTGVECGLESDWTMRNVYCNHPGGRGNAQKWWSKYLAEQERHRGRLKFVWCAFNVEQLRHLRPSPFHLPGWLVMPRERIQFIWGGETDGAKVHGEPCKQPTNCEHSTSHCVLASACLDSCGDCYCSKNKPGRESTTHVLQRTAAP